MILGQILKQIFASLRARGRIEEPAGAASAPRFIREKTTPSILSIANEYHATGAAEMLCFLLGHLTRTNGWQVCAYAKNLAESDREAVTRIGVKLVDVINPEQYDLAIINTVVMGIESVPELHDRLPCVLWIHEGESMLWNSRVPLCDWKEAFSWTSHIVFQSAWQAERIWGSFTSGLPTNRYSVVPNCQPIELLDASLVRRPTPGKRRVIFLGSVYQRKRPHDLIDAVLSLKRDDVECLFIGPTDGLATLSSYHQSLLRSRSGLLLVGKVSRSEALAYLASADVLSLPSADESQPLVLLEAARFGIPVVISDLPVYQHCWTDGVNCLKHAVGDVETLARHLATCLDGKAPKPTLSADCNPSEGEFLAQFDSILARMLPAKVGASGLR